MLNVDQVFLAKVEDLEARCAGQYRGTHVEYEVLLMSALIRELIVSNPRLMDLANRDRKVPVRFRITEGEHPEVVRRLDFYARADDLDPNIPPMSPDPPVVLDLSRDQFLKQTAIANHGEAFTIHDIIDFTANAAGGVHYGNFAPAKRQALREAADTMSMRGMDAASYMLLPIGRVVVAALQPLVHHVMHVARVTG